MTGGVHGGHAQPSYSRILEDGAAGTSLAILSLKEHPSQFCLREESETGRGGALLALREQWLELNIDGLEVHLN